MRTARQTDIRRALLKVLCMVPEGYMLPERLLRAEAARLLVPPAPTTAELDAEIRDADTVRLVIGLPSEDCLEYKISTAGRAWLAEHS